MYVVAGAVYLQQWAGAEPTHCSNCTNDSSCLRVLTCAQELLKGLEDLTMAHRLGNVAGTAGAEHATLQLQLEQLAKAGAVINEQEQLLDMRCTLYSDLDEARRVLLELQQSQQQQQQPTAPALAAGVDGCFPVD